MPSVISAGTASNTALTLSSDTSGELQIRTNNGSTTAMTLTTGGNVGIGTTSPAGRLEVNLNTTTGTGVSGTGVLANFTGLDAAAASIYSTAYGSNNGTQFIFRAAQGTAAAPTALVANNAIVRLLALGYNGSAFTGSRSEITIQASENWTSTANGTYIRFNTTTDGTTGSSERMRITSAGDVGIGTNSPSAKLDVRGNMWVRQSDGSYFNFTSTSTVADIEFSNTPALRFVYNAVTEVMRMNSSGNVGIGTSSFVGSERVNITFNSSGATTQALNTRDSNASANGNYHIVLRRSDDTYLGGLRRVGTDNAMGVDGNAYLSLQTTGTERMRIDSSGNVGIGTSIAGQRLTIGANGAFRLQTGSVTMDCTPTPGATDGFVWNQSANGYYDWSLSGTPRMRITSGGNVLVGTTTSPVQHTSTAGSIVATGSVNSFSGNVGNTTTGNSYNLFTAVAGASYIVNINAANTCSVYLVTCEVSSSVVTNTPLLIQNGANVTNSGTTIRFTNNFGGNLNNVGWSAIRLI